MKERYQLFPRDYGYGQRNIGYWRPTSTDQAPAGAYGWRHVEGFGSGC